MENEIKAKIFAQYLGCQVSARKKNDSDKDYLTGRSCEVTIKSNHGNWVMVWFDDIHTVTNHNWNESSSNAHTFFFEEDECMLLLKPLSSITDEDAVMVAKIATKQYSERQQEYINENMTYAIKERLDDTLIINFGKFSQIDIDFDGDIQMFMVTTGKCMPEHIEGLHETKEHLYSIFLFEAYQYLQSKSYALPYGPYSVDQLVQLGVYKLIK